MNKSIIFKILSILVLFVAIMTLGGLGNAAVVEPFYWVPFVIDIPLFGFVCYKLFKYSDGE